MPTSRMLSLVAVVVALAVAAGLTVWHHTLKLAAASLVVQPHAVRVNTVVRACPAPGLQGSPDAGLALIAGPAASGTGRAVVTYLGAAEGSPVLSATQPGTLSLAKVHGSPKAAHGKTTHAKASPSPAPGGQQVATLPAPGGVLIQATGSMARGLEAEQVTSGKLAARCGAPGTDFWFAGPGVYTARGVYLYLMNPGSQPADVNVTALTDAGPLVGSADTGIAVAPHAMVVQSLGKMLHGARAMALHVRTSVGQVVAAVEETTGSAHTGAWLPALAPPANQVVVPGLPPTAGTRELFLTVPGTANAHVALRAITTKGSYQPTAAGGLDIPGGSVAELSLTSLSAIPAALQVSANVPVTASVLIPGGLHGTPGTITGAAGAIQEQGVVAANTSGGGSAASLVLSAPWRAVAARVVEIAQGSGAQPATGKVLQIPAHHTLVEQLGKANSRHGTSFAVIVTPLAGSGPLYAGRVITSGGKGGGLESIVPVPSALTTVPLPVVRNALISPGG
jgi:hypothetical protein